MSDSELKICTEPLKITLDKNDDTLDSQVNTYSAVFNREYNFLQEKDTSNSNNYTLKTQLKHWAVTRGVTYTSITKLLHILSHYYSDIPKDCRTLLNTPTNIKV